LVPLPSRDIIFDLGPHPVDICNFVLNEWPYKVMGRSKSYVRNKPGREEEALFVMEFPKGKDAFVELSWISPGEKMREVYVRGSKATVKVDALRQHVRLYGSSGTGQLADIGQSIEVTENNTIATEVEHFIKQILGSRTSVSSGYIGARTVEVLEAVRRSSMDERSVYLQERPERSDFSQGTAYSSSKGVRSEIKLEFATK